MVLLGSTMSVLFLNPWMMFLLYLIIYQDPLNSFFWVLFCAIPWCSSCYILFLLLFICFLPVVNVHYIECCFAGFMFLVLVSVLLNTCHHVVEKAYSHAGAASRCFKAISDRFIPYVLMRSFLTWCHALHFVFHF